MTFTINIAYKNGINIHRTELTNFSLELFLLSSLQPAISVGNVGQLATDILISTTLAENLGVIYDESLLPMIGNDPYTNGDTNNSCKLSSSCDG